MPTGMLTRKIQCQFSRSVRIPPARTPMTPPPERTKPNTPIAFARSAVSVKSNISSDSATAETIAPPTPCTARAAMSSPCELASPQASDAAVKSEMPIEEQPPMTEEIAEPAAEEKKAAESQQVRVDHPGERGLREAEVVPDRRQRDVHDRAVEDDHDVAQAEDVERDPAFAVVQGHRRSFRCRSRSVRPAPEAELIGRTAMSSTRLTGRYVR